VEFAPIRV